MKNICLLILFIISVLAIGCSSNSADKTPNESSSPLQNVTYFPVQKEAAEWEMLVLLPGKLVVDNVGHLRVNVTNDLHPLIIWPYGYSLKTEGNDIWVIDDKGQTVAKVGDTVKIGGGEVPGYWAEEKIGQPLPAGCEGPYWLAGHINKNE